MGKTFYNMEDLSEEEKRVYLSCLYMKKREIDLTQRTYEQAVSDTDLIPDEDFDDRMPIERVWIWI